MPYAKTTSVEQRLAIVAQFERSGLTLKEFGRQQGINEATLGWWRRIARHTEQNSSKVELVEIGAKRSNADRAVEVVLPNGICLRVPAGFERRSLEEILAVVRAC